MKHSMLQKHDHDDTLLEIKKFINRNFDKYLMYKNYKSFTNNENLSFTLKKLR